MPKKIPLIPLADRVVLVPDPVPERSGLLYVPESKWAQPSDRGTVVRVGLGGWDEDGEREPLALCEGDHVLFTRVRGMQVTIGETVYLLLREVDVLATLPA
jgi:chaperonin GroES